MPYVTDGGSIFLFLMSRTINMGTCMGRPRTVNREIVLIRDPATRDALWEEYYFEQWGMLANRHRQCVMQAFWKETSVTRIEELLTENSVYQEMVRTGSHAVASEVMMAALNRLVAREVVKTTIGGAVRVGREGWEMSAFAETTTFAAVQGTNAARALAGVVLGPAIASIVGQQVARIAGEKLGVSDPQAKNVLNAGGAVASGALVGACVGGRIGALAGAAVGALSWGLRELMSGALDRRRPTKVVPRDNWCYCEIGSLSDGVAQLCFGTYSSGDTVYRETYHHEYRGQNSNWVMSAGQPQDGSFQLCMWVGNAIIKVLKVVYYRDRIRVIRKRRTYHIVHCRGQFHPGRDSGTTVVYKIKIRRH